MVGFTDRAAFSSPRAVVVIAAVGAVAVLLQLRFRNRNTANVVRPPVWLNVLGIGFALAALFADHLHFSADLGQLMALCAVGSFAISSAVILHAFRKERIIPKSDSE